MAGGEGESLIGFEGVEGPAGGAGDLEKFLQQVIEDAAADECGDPDGQVVPAAAQAEEPPHRGGDAEDNDEIAQAGDEREEKDELRLRVEVEEFFEGLVAEPELAVMGFIGGVIAAAVYNLVAKWTGGLEITLSDAPPPVV